MPPKNDGARPSAVFLDIDIGDQNDQKIQEEGYRVATEYYNQVKSQVGTTQISDQSSLFRLKTATTILSSPHTHACTILYVRSMDGLIRFKT